jgi:hypothetical protein
VERHQSAVGGSRYPGLADDGTNQLAEGTREEASAMKRTLQVGMLAGLAAPAGLAALLALVTIGGSARRVPHACATEPPEIVTQEGVTIGDTPGFRIIRIEPQPPPIPGDRPLFPPRDFVLIGSGAQ